MWTRFNEEAHRECDTGGLVYLPWRIDPEKGFLGTAFTDKKYLFLQEGTFLLCNEGRNWFVQRHGTAMKTINIRHVTRAGRWDAFERATREFSPEVYETRVRVMVAVSSVVNYCRRYRTEMVPDHVTDNKDCLGEYAMDLVARYPEKAVLTEREAKKLKMGLYALDGFYVKRFFEALTKPLPPYEAMTKVYTTGSQAGLADIRYSSWGYC